MVFKCFNCNSKENLFTAPQTPDLQERWLELFPEGDVNIFNDSFRICAEHFDNKYIMPTGVLSARAVPTKFLVHNVWCEVEDINDDQQDNQLELSPTSSQPLENDQGQQDMSPTAPEVLMDCYTDEMSGSFIDTFYPSNSQESRLAPVQITNKYTSTPIASHPSGKEIATSNLIPKKSKERTSPLVNNTHQRQDSDSDLRLKSESIFSGGESHGSMHVSPGVGTFQNVMTSRLFNHSLNSSYPADGTFSPMTDSNKLVSDHTSLNRSKKLSLFTTKNSIFNKSDVLSRKKLTPVKKSILDTPKITFFDVSNSHKKRVKFNTSDDIVPFLETEIKAHKISKNQPQKSSKEEWEKSAKALFGYDKKSKSRQTKVRNEASYATKRRKKVPIVLLKRLKFPNNMMPPRGTLLSISMLEQLNAFQVDGAAPRSKKPSQGNLLGVPNGLFGLNSYAPRMPVVDLTLDEDSSGPEVEPVAIESPAPPAPCTPPSPNASPTPCELLSPRSPLPQRSPLTQRSPFLPHSPLPHRTTLPVRTPIPLRTPIPPRASPSQRAPVPPRTPLLPRVLAKPATPPSAPKSVKKITRIPPRVEFIPPKVNSQKSVINNSIEEQAEPVPVSNKLSNSFEVRHDVPLKEQLKLYQAELERVRTIQTSLYKQYSTHATHFKKLQHFLDQLAKSGLIMKRHDQ